MVDVITPKSEGCPVCRAGRSTLHDNIDGYDYFRCESCGSLHVSGSVIDRIDAGHSTRIYDKEYWNEELKAARERAAGEAQVRVGEAFLYTRRPITRFLDIGTGPGYLLDTLSRQFPVHDAMFHGVELYPPEQHSKHPNYLVGSLSDLDKSFDAGVCIEVVGHLTPKMLKEMAQGLSAISEQGALWLFNTGMPEYVLNEDPRYLDPLRRGHIVSYGLTAIKEIFEPFGFQVLQVPGKDYAWVAEYVDTLVETDFEQRIWHPVAENLALLREAPLVYQAAFESARASLHFSQMLERTKWAQDLDVELANVTERCRQLAGERDHANRLVELLRAKADEPRNRNVGTDSEVVSDDREEGESK